MTMKHIDAIIFDLGGVLINLDYQLTIDAFRNLGADPEQLKYSQASQTNLFDDFETGQISSQAFINTIKNHVPAEVTPNQIVAAWNAMILDFPIEKLALLERLTAEKRIFLLSNTNDIHIQKVNRALAKVSEKTLDNYFEKVYLSQEIKMRKPHPEIFEFVCKDADLEPSKTLFIDDSEQHILGAKSIGLHTIHLTNPNDLLSYF